MCCYVVQNVSGILYDIVVELAETVCPKYKEHINKARCRIDTTEDVKVGTLMRT